MAKKSLNVNGKRVSISYDDPQMPLSMRCATISGCMARASVAEMVSAVLAPSTLTAPLCGLVSLQSIP